MHPLTFWLTWELLCKVWQENGHCLKKGCGSKTLAAWVGETCGVSCHPSMLKCALKESVRRGMASEFKNPCGYRAYLFLDETLKRYRLYHRIPVVYCHGTYKQTACERAGYKVDIWIDDVPGMIQPCKVLEDDL